MKQIIVLFLILGSTIACQSQVNRIDISNKPLDTPWCSRFFTNDSAFVSLNGTVVAKRRLKKKWIIVDRQGTNRVKYLERYFFIKAHADSL